MKIRLKKGEILFLQGESGFIYLLTSGLLKVVRTKEDGSSTLLNILVPGELFPHHSLISAKANHGTVIAMTECDVQKMKQGDWLKVIQENPYHYKGISEILQSRLRMMQERIDILTAQSDDKIPMFRKWLRQYFPGSPIEEILTQEEIGQFVGLTRESVNRWLRKERTAKTTSST